MHVQVDACEFEWHQHARALLLLLCFNSKQQTTTTTTSATTSATTSTTTTTRTTITTTTITGLLAVKIYTCLQIATHEAQLAARYSQMLTPFTIPKPKPQNHSSNCDGGSVCSSSNIAYPKPNKSKRLNNAYSNWS
jgi:hypothetical protein